MNTIKLSNTDFHVPAVAAGCMRINCLDEKALSSYIEGCIELGINFFDHADIFQMRIFDIGWFNLFDKQRYKSYHQLIEIIDG